MWLRTVVGYPPVECCRRQIPARRRPTWCVPGCRTAWVASVWQSIWWRQEEPVVVRGRRPTIDTSSHLIWLSIWSISDSQRRGVLTCRAICRPSRSWTDTGQRRGKSSSGGTSGPWIATAPSRPTRSPLASGAASPLDRRWPDALAWYQYARDRAVAAWSADTARCCCQLLRSQTVCWSK